MIKILIVDDNESIHHDFKKVLTGRAKNKLKSVEMALFGEDDVDLQVDEPTMDYKVEDAFQGQEAFDAYAVCSREFVKEIGESDKLQFLRKPFDMVTVQQLALATMKKREAAQEKAREMARLKQENQGARAIQAKVLQLAGDISAQLDICRQAARDLEERVSRRRAESNEGPSQFLTDTGHLSQNISLSLSEAKAIAETLRGAFQ